MWGSGSGSGPLGGLQGLFQPFQRNSAGSGRGDDAAAQPSASSSLPEAFDDSRTSTRRVKVRKVRGPGGPQGEEFASQAERRIAEIVPGLADLSISASAMEGPMRTARDIRIEKLRQQQSTIDEIRELEDIYDMAKPNPVDEEPRPEGWEPKERPTPRSVRLSPYEYEMINYQRMLMRKNIWCATCRLLLAAEVLLPLLRWWRAWQAGSSSSSRSALTPPPPPSPRRYYRDRMSVPRGPCPLHVLKEAWTSGVIDENTMVWGHGLFDWLPIKNVKLLVPMIRTPEGARAPRAWPGCWLGAGCWVLGAGRLAAGAWRLAAGGWQLLLAAGCWLVLAADEAAAGAQHQHALLAAAHAVPRRRCAQQPRARCRRRRRLTPAPSPAPAVRFAAWVKRTFSLKPSLERIREARRTIRTSEVQSQQVERMR
jgi:hypothetical protein